MSTPRKNSDLINRKTSRFSRPVTLSLVTVKSFLTHYAEQSNRVYEQGVCIVITYSGQPDLICVNAENYERLRREDRAMLGKVCFRTSVSQSKNVTVREVTRGFAANVRHPLKVREVEAVVMIRRGHPAIAFLPIRAFDRVPELFTYLTLELGYTLDNPIFD